MKKLVSCGRTLSAWGVLAACVVFAPAAAHAAKCADGSIAMFVYGKGEVCPDGHAPGHGPRPSPAPAAAPVPDRHTGNASASAPVPARSPAAASALTPEQMVVKALHEVFAPEEARAPGLAAYLADPRNRPVQFALGDLRAGREGGGYEGVRKWLGRPEVKQWYLVNAGINEHLPATSQDHDAVVRALHEVFAAEERQASGLDAYLGNVGNSPYKFAMGDMKAGREGGGYEGIRRWLSRPEVKKYYVDNAGIGQFMRQAQTQQMGGDTAAVTRALHEVFAPEEARAPGLAAYIADPRNRPVQFALGDLRAGREGGGYEGVRKWLGRPEVKQWYLVNAGINEHLPATSQDHDAVVRALHEVFAGEERQAPGLAAYVGNAGNAPYKFAMGDMKAGREGGGYQGIRRWLSRPEVKKYYMDNAGIGQFIAQSGQLAQPQVIRKLYVMDGTGAVQRHRNAMWHLSQRFRGHWYYHPGVTDRVGASDAQRIFDEAYNRICQDVKPVAQGGRGVTDVLIAGFSRGAITAVRLAKETHRDCGANVTFLGLVDPVNTSMNEHSWPTSVTYPVKSSIMLFKSRWGFNWGVLETKHIGNIEEKQVPFGNVGHEDMTCPYLSDPNNAARWVESTLEAYAGRVGATFGGDDPDTNNCND